MDLTRIEAVYIEAAGNEAALLDEACLIDRTPLVDP